jgi:hypothetical protein
MTSGFRAQHRHSMTPSKSRVYRCVELRLSSVSTTHGCTPSASGVGASPNAQAGLYAHAGNGHDRTRRTRPERSGAALVHLYWLANAPVFVVNNKTRCGPRAMRFAMQQSGPAVSVVPGRVRFPMGVDAGTHILHSRTEPASLSCGASRMSVQGGAAHAARLRARCHDVCGRSRRLGRRFCPRNVAAARTVR